ncbi:MAG: inverse autotransporter beta domain-containing protein [Fuerstiella sp.]
MGNLAWLAGVLLLRTSDAVFLVVSGVSRTIVEGVVILKVDRLPNRGCCVVPVHDSTGGLRGMRPVTSSMTLMIALLLSASAKSTAADEAAPWISRFTAKHIFGDGVGYQDGFTSLEWFLPLEQDSENEMWFGDFRGIMFDDAEFGGNLGTGYRWHDPEQDRIYGVNGYWDFRNQSGLLFNQAGIGVESLGRLLDFRANAYTPTVNDADQRVGFSFIGNNLLNTEYRALSGFDYELAVNLPDFREFQSSIAGGGYYFDSSKTAAAAGWRTRFEIAFRDTLAAAVSVQDDNVYGQTLNVTVEYRYTAEHLNNMARRSMYHKFRNSRGTGDDTIRHRLADPVHRQQNIVLLQARALVTDSSNTPLTFLHVVEGGAGDGTIEMPFGTITDAMADPLAPTSVVFTPQGGNFTENVTLVSGTRLLSNGPVQSVTSSVGTVQLPFSGVSTDLSALPASIVGDVVLADNTELSGFDITGGVSGTGITTASVNQTAINMSPADALGFTGSDDITIDQLAISMPTGRGIFLSDTSATLSNVTIADAGDDGIQIDSAATDRAVTATNITVTDAANEGIDVNVAGAGNLTFGIDSSSVTSTNNAFDIVTTSTGHALLSADSLTLASTAATGFNADGSGGAGTLFINSFAGNTVAGAKTGGVLLNTVTFDADPAAAGNQALSSGTLTIGSTSSRVEGAGLSLTDGTGDWNTGVLSIFNTTGTGLYVDNSVLGIPVALSSEAGSVVDSEMGQAIGLDTVTSGLLFDSITSLNSPGVGIGIKTVSGTLTSGAATSTGSASSSVRYENIPLASPLTTSFGNTTFSNTIDEVGDTSGLTQN